MLAVVNAAKASWVRMGACTAVQTGKDQSQVNCKEDTANADARVPAPSVGQASTPTGCQYDTQCKGDRVCEHGQCVDASAQKPAKDPPTESAP